MNSKLVEILDFVSVVFAVASLCFFAVTITVAMVKGGSTTVCFNGYHEGLIEFILAWLALFWLAFRGIDAIWRVTIQKFKL